MLKSTQFGNGYTKEEVKWGYVSDGDGGISGDRVVKEGLSGEVASELCPMAEKEPAMEGVEKCVPGSGNSMCRGPEAGPRLTCLRCNSKRPERLGGSVGEVRLAWAAGAWWHGPHMHGEQFGFGLIGVRSP